MNGERTVGRSGASGRAMGRLVGLGAILALTASAAVVRVEITSLHTGAAQRIELRTGGAPNQVTIENRHPGTDAWELGRPGFQIADDTHGQIKGYASATSVDAGAPIGFHVAVN